MRSVTQRWSYVFLCTQPRSSRHFHSFTKMESKSNNHASFQMYYIKTVDQGLLCHCECISFASFSVLFAGIRKQFTYKNKNFIEKEILTWTTRKFFTWKLNTTTNSKFINVEILFWKKKYFKLRTNLKLNEVDKKSIGHNNISYSLCMHSRRRIKTPGL